MIKSQNSPFSHNQTFSHKRPNFDSKSYSDKSKVLLYSFSKVSQVVADPFALALFSPPLASSTKTGSFFALKTPLPHQNRQLRVKRQ
jgi:hypothetical protein